VVGIVSGLLIGLATEYCTSHAYYPVRSIAAATEMGPATVMIQVRFCRDRRLRIQADQGRGGLGYSSLLTYIVKYQGLLN
jgi:hypothetical protein